MKRRILTIITVTALITASLSACGRNNAGTEGVGTTGADTGAEEVSAEGAEAITGEQQAGVAGSEAEDPQATDDKPITIVTHPVSCEVSGKEVSNGSYPEIAMTPEFSGQYLNLYSEIYNLNAFWKDSVEYSVKEYAFYQMDSETPIDYPYSSEISADVVRADDALFTVLVSYYDYAGGAHPSHSTESVNIDPATGKIMEFAEVLNDTAKAAKAIHDELYASYPELKDEFDSFTFLDEGQTINDYYEGKINNNLYTWNITTEGLHIVFSPYEMASYAAGYQEILLTYDKYPNLIKEEYIPTSDLDKETMVGAREMEKEMIQPSSPNYVQDENGEFHLVENEGSIKVANKSWKAFTEDGRGPDDGEHITLTKTREEKTDWLDTEVWADQHGFEVAKLPYSDDDYTYVGEMPMDYAYMYNRLDIYDHSGDTLLYSLDLYDLCNGPDEETGTYSRTTQYIRWAKIYDGTLYVSIGHNGYSSEEPNSSYMVAIAPDTGYVLWRSEPLVANSNNFLLVKDTIICGYGFTAEPDYIYLLDRFTGQITEKIPVRSAAYQFNAVDDTLYVATYNTAYEFEITTK